MQKIRKFQEVIPGKNSRQKGKQANELRPCLTSYFSFSKIVFVAFIQLAQCVLYSSVTRVSKSIISVQSWSQRD